MLAVSVISIAAFLFSLTAIFIGFRHSIFDFHGFRQAQTAITAEYMQRGGPFLHYETPVFGPPWSIPFEFPLYQKIVAEFAAHLHTPLDETGRAVSIAFFYLSFLPLASILRRLKYSTIQISAVLALLAVSPLYILVSRMFMIESTALFLSIMYVDQTVRLVTAERQWPSAHMIATGFFGVLAGLVKVTTFAPYLMLACGLIVWHAWKLQRRKALAIASAIAAAFFGLLVPVLCTVAWTKFADAQKLKNPLGAFFTSKALTDFNFGTLAERLSTANYISLLHHVPGQAGSLPLLVLVAVVYGILVRRWNYAALIALGLYVATPMIFFHLHVLHVYYPYSSAIFLVVAAGMLIADMLALQSLRAWIGFVLLVALIGTCIDRYRENAYVFQKLNAPGRPDVAAIIDRTTKSNDVVLITGLDWSSELPYQSHRRAIMDSAGVASDFPSSLGPIATAIRNQHADKIPEVVVCDSMRSSNRSLELLQAAGIQSSDPLRADNCDIYLRTAK